jgi:signal transduction histidine kinase
MDKPIRLLLVTDKDGDAAFLRAALAAGCIDRETTTAADLQAAASALAAAPYDAVLLDIALVAERPAEAVRRLRGLRDLPILVITSSAEMTAAGDALAAGAQDYILWSSFNGGTLAHRLQFCMARFWENREVRVRLQKAELANQTKSQFLAHMSHELRTPLNCILGFTEMMQRGVFGTIDNTRYVDYLQSISHSGGHLLTLINNLLDLSKIEAGREELQETTVDVGELLHAVTQAEQPAARRRGLSLSCAVKEDALLCADPVKLEQVILNLLSNAMKFTPEGGQITLTGRGTAEGGYEIVIADTGCGMAPDEIPQAMTTFAQIHNPFLRKGDRGSGLGLPIARGLVALHQGRLEIASRRGAGTRVSVRLPASRRLPSPRAIAPGTAAQDRAAP